MVSLERFDHFLHDMETRGVTVLLCGVRPAFAKAMANLHFHDWLPGDRVFPEEAENFLPRSKPFAMFTNSWMRIFAIIICKLNSWERASSLFIRLAA